jgi:hypothetical protein
MEKVYIIRWFDMHNWREVIPICYATEPEAIDYCLTNTNFEAGVVCSYQEIRIGKQEVKQEIKDKISNDLSKKLLNEIGPKSKKQTKSPTKIFPKKIEPKKDIEDV